MAIIAHLSDTHIDGAHNRSTKRLARVMTYLNRLPGHIDAIVVTGDVADHGTELEYRAARDLLQSDIPVFMCPGNHDDRSNFRKFLFDEEGVGPINSAHVVGNCIIVLCDSSIPGESHGVLAPDTLSWLRGVLDEAPSDANILIGLHHPPIRLFSPIIDPIRLTEVDEFAELVGTDDRVRAILCGHAHTSAVTTFAGKLVIVAPSVASVLGPEWEGGADGGTNGTPTVDHGPLPAVAFHVIDEDNRLTTHFRTVAKGVNRYSLARHRH
ncbi:phosphodiesterase [Skermania sp. ID1734]|uniref:metallophosphoesterase n=1 Tax=Skermania sp. ID1734 TaxID=2597516 RepID=UPI00117F3FD1|nr:metallophosphoesterase [Skermania sp. ID1734]TSD99648.1 phosphodiesterase [Skermania sp. ID1734]